jgi:transposase InsO family protein
VRVYRFISDQKADFDVKTLCRVCRVPRSSYYDWERAEVEGADARWAEATLANRIYDTWKASRGRYGAPRIAAQLRREGLVVNRKRVERLMADLGIRGACGRRRVRTTVRDPKAKPAPDLVERDFTAPELDRLWVGDVTFIPTDEGWLYLATVIDVYSRRLVGWSIADHLRAELCVDALRQAGLTRGGGRLEGLRFHSDRGCQYTSDAYRAACAALGITQSMGSVGDSYDNAMAESFFSSLKRELVDEAHFSTKTEARTLVFQWIIWYNRQRLHSSLGYLPPEEFEQLWRNREAA